MKEITNGPTFTETYTFVEDNETNARFSADGPPGQHILAGNAIFIRNRVRDLAADEVGSPEIVGWRVNLTPIRAA